MPTNENNGMRCAANNPNISPAFAGTGKNSFEMIICFKMCKGYVLLPMAGNRNNSNGSLNNVGSNGNYWSSTVSGTNSLYLRFYSTNAAMSDLSRARGSSVRCIKADPPPAQPSPINGPTNPCENATGLIYNVTNVPGVTYTWTVPTGWSITGGQGTYEITVTAGTAAGNIEVTPSNTGGSGPAQTLAVTTQVCLYPTGYVHCDPANPTAVVDVTNPTTGKIWMDRNLGASQAATSSTDANSYGDLYQWGRGADGHQCRTSPTTATLSPSDQPGHGNFIRATSTPWDWRSPQNTNLWQGVSGVNNPCPIGYRIPTEAELNAERLSWNPNYNSVGAFASPLKLPLAGRRDASSSGLYGVGTYGYYWSSDFFTSTLNSSKFLLFFSSNTYIDHSGRAYGRSVRCIKDY